LWSARRRRGDPAGARRMAPRMPEASMKRSLRTGVPYAMPSISSLRYDRRAPGGRRQISQNCRSVPALSPIRSYSTGRDQLYVGKTGDGDHRSAASDR
jgi:hypothetical protein